MDILNGDMLLAAFGSGVFAASLGIIGAFSFSGFIVLLGVVAACSGHTEFQGLIAFGPCFGPHVFFASAVASAAYAGRRGNLLEGCVPVSLDACRDVLVPLNKFKRTDVLLIGGVFGVFSHIVQLLLAESGISVDTVALTVVISNGMVRLVMGKSGIRGFFGRNPKAIKLLTFDKTLFYNLFLGFSVGLLSSYLTQVTGSLVIGFGISAVTLIFLFHSEVPVTHHISICAAYASAASGSLLAGGLSGALAALAGIIFINLFNYDSDTYMDFPALSISLLSAVIFNFM